MRQSIFTAALICVFAFANGCIFFSDDCGNEPEGSPFANQAANPEPEGPGETNLEAALDSAATAVSMKAVSLGRMPLPLTFGAENPADMRSVRILAAKLTSSGSFIEGGRGSFRLFVHTVLPENILIVKLFPSDAAHGPLLTKRYRLDVR